mgnify:CR=1 FL=1
MRAAISWMLLEWVLVKKPKFVGLLTGAVAGLAEQVDGAPADHLFAELEKGLEDLLEVQHLRLAAVERQHVAAEGGLHLGEAEQLVQHDLGGGVARLRHGRLFFALDALQIGVNVGHELLYRILGRQQFVLLAFDGLSHLRVGVSPAPGFVRSLSVFDVYTGENIDSGLKSIALSLILQESSRTLTDQEVDSSIEKIVDTLKEKLSATLRE